MADFSIAWNLQIKLGSLLLLVLTVRSEMLQNIVRVFVGFFFFFKDGKMWWHENWFHLKKSQQPSLANKTLVWHGPSWKPSSHNLEPSWVLDVWNRPTLGLLLGYCSISATKDGVLFRRDFVAGVGWWQGSCARRGCSGWWWRGWSTQESCPEPHWWGALLPRPGAQCSALNTLFPCPNSHTASSFFLSHFLQYFPAWLLPKTHPDHS